MKRIALIVAPLLLAGCTGISQMTVQDATQAAAINPANAICYQEFGVIGGQLAGVKSPGLLTTAALYLQLQADVDNPACAPVIASILGLALKGISVP
jgi:hypothetical protein